MLTSIPKQFIQQAIKSKLSLAVFSAIVSRGVKALEALSHTDIDDLLLSLPLHVLGSNQSNCSNPSVLNQSIDSALDKLAENNVVQGIEEAGRKNIPFSVRAIAYAQHIYKMVMQQAIEDDPSIANTFLNQACYLNKSNNSAIELSQRNLGAFEFLTTIIALISKDRLQAVHPRTDCPTVLDDALTIHSERLQEGLYTPKGSQKWEAFIKKCVLDLAKSDPRFLWQLNGLSMQNCSSQTSDLATGTEAVTGTATETAADNTATSTVTDTATVTGTEAVTGTATATDEANTVTSTVTGTATETDAANTVTSTVTGTATETDAANTVTSTELKQLMALLFNITSPEIESQTTSILPAADVVAENKVSTLSDAMTTIGISKEKTQELIEVTTAMAVAQLVKYLEADNNSFEGNTTVRTSSIMEQQNVESDFGKLMGAIIGVVAGLIIIGSAICYARRSNGNGEPVVLEPGVGARAGAEVITEVARSPLLEVDSTTVRRLGDPECIV